MYQLKYTEDSTRPTVGNGAWFYFIIDGGEGCQYQALLNHPESKMEDWQGK